MTDLVFVPFKQNTTPIKKQRSCLLLHAFIFYFFSFYHLILSSANQHSAKMTKLGLIKKMDFKKNKQKNKNKFILSNQPLTESHQLIHSREG